MKQFFRIVAVGASMVAAGAQGEVVYSNDFERAIGPEWTRDETERTPIGGRGFLGRFGSENVALFLNDLPTHGTLTVEFDLYLTGDWLGLLDPLSPDTFNVNVQFGPNVFNASFSNYYDDGGFYFDDPMQSFPSQSGRGRHASRTGAAENNSLGYTRRGRLIDSVYRISVEFAHERSYALINFSGSVGGFDVEDAGWGIDNIEVRAVPEPASLVALGLGLSAFRQRRRRRSLPS
jgi:hypothetical protein